MYMHCMQGLDDRWLIVIIIIQARTDYQIIIIILTWISEGGMHGVGMDDGFCLICRSVRACPLKCILASFILVYGNCYIVFFLFSIPSGHLCLSVSVKIKLGASLNYMRTNKQTNKASMVAPCLLEICIKNIAIYDHHLDKHEEQRDFFRN